MARTSAQAEIRRAHSDEYDAIQHCVKDAYQKWADIIGYKPKPMLDDYHALIERGVVYVVPGESGIRGVLVIRSEGGALIVENVCVCPAYQHEGIGRMLIIFAEAQGRASGQTMVRLSANGEMGASIAFFKRVGFHITERDIDRHWSGKWGRFLSDVTVWMEKPL